MHRRSLCALLLTVFTSLLLQILPPTPVLAQTLDKSIDCKPQPCAHQLSLASTAVRVFNERLAVQAISNGRFTLGAFPDPQTGDATVNSWDLIFSWPEESDTSFTTFRIDTTDAVYGTDGIMIQEPTVINPTTIESVWRIGTDIEVKQTLQIVDNIQTGLADTAKIAYRVRNIGSVAHTVGSRVMIDTEINGNDGAPYRVPGEIISTEREFVGASVPDSFQAFFSVTNSERVAGATLHDPASPAPDRLVFASWPLIEDTDFDYTINSTQVITDDSAYAVYWNPTTLPAGTTRTYVTYYGLSQLSGDLQPPLALVVGSPVTIANDGALYEPNPFVNPRSLQQTKTMPFMGLECGKPRIIQLGIDNYICTCYLGPTPLVK